jgi:hypothetical protein
MRSNKYFRTSLSIALSAFALCFFAVTADAQRPGRTPKPLATPPPVLTGAEIISRAGEDVVEIPEAEPIATPIPGTGYSESPSAALKERITKGKKLSYDEKQKRLMMNLDILTRAEQRTESLRKQLFEMIEKENTVKTRLDQIEYDARPEMIDRSAQLVGSLRPEEIRNNRRKSLDAERTNLQALLNEIQINRANLNTNLLRADAMVEKLRTKLEKEIDDALIEEEDTDQ